MQQTTKIKYQSKWIIFLRRQKLVVFLYCLVVVWIVFHCLCLLFAFVFKKSTFFPVEKMKRHTSCIFEWVKNFFCPIFSWFFENLSWEIGLKTVVGLWLIHLLFRDPRFCIKTWCFCNIIISHHHLLVICRRSFL